MVKKMDRKITSIVLIACLLCGVGVVLLDQRWVEYGVQSPVMQSPVGTFVLEAPVPDAPQTAPVYTVTGTDTFFKGTPEIMNARENVPSQEEAPMLAEDALAPYGGLPKDAVLKDVEVISLREVNTTSGSVEAVYPQWTQVIYTQQVDGMPVVGPGAEIIVSLGEDGEVLEVSKMWRNLTYARDVRITPVSEAVDAIQAGNVIDRPQSPLGYTKITGIALGYYAEDISSPQKEYTPVWIFSGTEENSGNAVHVVVEAREHPE